MKRTNLLLAIGVFCVLTGTLVCYLWYQSQLPPTTQRATDAVTEPATDDSKPNRGGGRADKFATLDADHDGQLSLSEFSVGRAPAEAKKWFERRDADHDGFISKQEFLPQSAVSKTR